jgi:hypothetical protein
MNNGAEVTKKGNSLAFSSVYLLGIHGRGGDACNTIHKEAIT